MYFTFAHTGNKSAEELTKRYILDAVLKSQCSPTDNASVKSENDEDMESEDIVVSMTPPTSPKPTIASVHSTSTISRHSNSTVATTSALRDKSSIASASASTSVSSSISATTAAAASAASSTSSSSLNRPNSQDGPIDLSMKSTSSAGSSAKSAASPLNHHEHHHRDFMDSDNESTAALSEEELSVDQQRPLSANSCSDRPESRNDGKSTHIENPNGLPLRGTTPLDLTTKI